MLNYFPQYFSSKAISLYIGAVIVVSVLFFSHVMDWYWYVFGIVEVIGFFYFSTALTKQWANLSGKAFIKRLFAIAFILRLIWVVFSHFFYVSMTGQPFEFSSADALMYHEQARWIHQMIIGHNLESYWSYVGSRGGVSDMGYPFYLGIQYTLTGDSIFIARIIKALLSALTCVFIYLLTTRTFSNDKVGKIAAIFSMLMPNLIYYCGLHLKETEMLFLTVAFVERADWALRSKKFSFSGLILPLLLAGSLFFFRTVLGVTALFSFFTAVLVSPSRIIKTGKRIILIVWILLAVGYLAGGKISTEIEGVWANKGANQQRSMEYRARMKGGNQFVKYASTAVFAPMILMLPFPTIIDTQGQGNQRLIHGGNYDKNIMAFFVIFAFILLIKEKKWREYALTGSFLVSYLMVIAMSKFAASERFHMPVLPFFLIFAAYGVSRATNKTKKYYKIYLVFIFIVLIAWSWFKLAGRGAVDQ